MTETPDERPELQIDDDWKAQARAEKERLAQQEPAAEAADDPADLGSPVGGPRQMPPADFKTLVSSFVTQAMYALGMIPDPNTGQRMAILDLAKHQIDMLGVLQAKTEGNLDDEEQKLLATALYELRMQYVQVSQQAIEQQTGAAPGAAPGGVGL